MTRLAKGLCLPLLVLVLAPAVGFTQETQLRRPDVIYVPTPQNVVEEMLKLAEVGPADVVYDLGCGDGRLVITAVKQFGARGVGIDINPERITESLDNARVAEVTDRLEFRNEDLFEADIKDATVVTLYLLPDLNLKLRPKLLRDLKPGTRIVSHGFDMGDWAPDKQVTTNGRRVFLWIVPGNQASSN